MYVSKIVLTLSTGKANHSQRLKFQWSNAILKLRQVFLHGNGGNEFKFNLFVGGGNGRDHGKLSSVGTRVGIVGEDGFGCETVDYIAVDTRLVQFLVDIEYCRF